MHHFAKYDEDEVLKHYVLRNRSSFMTSLEKRAETLGMMREKARHRILDSHPDAVSWHEQRLAEYEAKTDEDIRKAIGDDLNSFVKFQQQITQRIDAAFLSGELYPNRCPACHRIVRTPEARQCLWCGHDWHIR